MIIVGVNGGGTKTEAMCCNEKGDLIGKSLTGSSNKDNVGIEMAVQNIKSAVTIAAKKDPDLICIALAGINTKRDYDRMYKRLSKEYKNLIVEHDAFAELYGAERGKPGIMAIAGTGSIVLGYDGQKRYRRCDNGYFLGDEGSGYYIGKEGLKITAKMLLEEMPMTDVGYDIMKHFGFLSSDDLLEWVHSEKNTVATIAAVARVVYTAAEKGDKNAKAIVDRASTTLAEGAFDLAIKLGLKTVHIKGGVIKSKLYYSNFSAILSSKGIVCKPMHESEAEGALLIAADKAGIKVKLQ